ncbi:MAG: response regulator RpfG family c-di-GMP phosphodiesterase [Gammaproteobacteria bacterium]|jgi:response regulator RpfG family c-di-GMP phosphodiesterase
MTNKFDGIYSKWADWELIFSRNFMPRSLQGNFIMTKILCIEDDQEQRFEIVDALTTEGFEVIEALNGHSGLKLILSEPVDLILCDRKM